MAVPENKKKMVVSAYFNTIAFAWRINNTYTRIGSCTIYLFDILKIYIIEELQLRKEEVQFYIYC